jgi:uncharacterized protein YjbJ (UPF0337 family)
MVQAQSSSGFFDNVVRMFEKPKRKIDAECPGGFQVNDKLNCCGVLNRKFASRRAAQDPCDEIGSASPQVSRIRLVAQQAALFSPIRPITHGRQPFWAFLNVCRCFMPQERLNSLHVEPATEERVMVDKNRVDGSAKNIGGKVKEGIGNVTGDSKMQTEGKADQAEGKIQNTIGGIKDSVKDAFKKD